MSQSNINFESLSEVLKNPIRRRIILCLSDRESISYVELMNSLEIDNTGKFNYHLKLLGDLIQKDESGKYQISEKGRLSVQFLQKFDNGNSVFETRSFSLFAGFIWLVLLYPFLGLIFGWYLYFTDPLIAIHNSAVSLITLSIILVPAFVLLGINQFPKIGVDRDGISVRWATGRSFFIMEEAKMDTRSHIIRLGGRLLPFGWFIPFKQEECFNLLSKRAETYRSKPLYVAFALPPTLLTILFVFAGRLEGFFPPELWAVFWGITMAISLAMMAYGFPAEIRLGNLDRGISVMIYAFLLE